MGISYRVWIAICIFVCSLFSAFSPIFGLDFPLEGAWKFHPINQSEVSPSEDDRAKTFSAKGFDDSGWENIPVPGYWDQPPGRWPWSSPAQRGGPYPDLDGEAWYRFQFSVPANQFPGQSDLSEFHATLRFQGVSAQSSVWLNGIFVGRHLGAFGPFELDATKALLRNESNVLAVRVRDKTAFHAGALGGQANLSSTIPLGFDPDVGGIRGSVSLQITPKERILDLAVESDPLSATVELYLSPDSIGQSSLTVELIEKSTGQKVELGEGKPMGAIPVTSSRLTVSLRDFGPEASPKPWSPESPNLYRLTVKLVNARGNIDVAETDLGFRTFEIRGGRFYLNGNPYFLLGAGSPPHYELPSEAVIRTHLSYLKEAGVRMVRFAYEPPTSEWLEVCDELGLLAWIEGPLSAEGTAYDFSKADLIDTASREMKNLARAYRNHPSAAIWTVGSGNCRVLSEVKVRRKAAEVLQSIANEVAQIDEDCIVLPESDSRGFLETVVEDWQSGIGWYTGKQEDWAPFLNVTASLIGSTTNPWVCSALETGYSSNGQGRIIPDPIEETATRMRIGISGDDRNRLLFAQSHRIKNLIEVTRSQRNPEKNRIAGIFPFTSANWFFHPLTEGQIRPKPIIASIREAYRPVILTSEFPKKNYYAGELLETTVTVVNDSPDQRVLDGWNLTLEAFVRSNEPDSQTQREIQEVKPYSSAPFNMTVVLPEDVKTLQRASIRARLFLGEEELASHESEIMIAPLSWSRPRSENPFGKVLIYDRPKESLQPYLEKYSLKPEALISLEQLSGAVGLIVGSGGFDDYINRAWPTLEKWIESGGKMAVLDQPLGSDRWAFSGPYPPGYVVSSPPGWPTGIDRVNVVMEGHPLFEGIRSEVLQDWGRDRAVAKSILNLPIRKSSHPSETLVHAAVEGGTVEWGNVVVEERISEGALLYSQLDLTSKSTLDPIASKVISNLIDWAGDSLSPVVFEMETGRTPFLAPLVDSPMNEITAPHAGTDDAEPIRALLAPDGPFEATQCCGIDPETKNGIIPLPHEYGPERRVYYDVDDRFWFEDPGNAEVKVLVNCLSPAKIRLDYDSTDNTVEHLGHYKQSNVIDVLEVGIWKEVVLSAPQASFGNGQKNGADFRLATVAGEVIYGPISLKRLD